MAPAGVLSTFSGFTRGRALCFRDTSTALSRPRPLFAGRRIVAIGAATEAEIPYLPTRLQTLVC